MCSQIVEVKEHEKGCRRVLLDPVSGSVHDFFAASPDLAGIGDALTVDIKRAIVNVEPLAESEPAI